MIKKIIALVVIILVFIAGLLYWVLSEMDIEDRYGDLTELYHVAEDENLIVIDGKEFGFIKRYGRDIFIDNQDCMKNILYYRNVKIELYDVKIPETLTPTDYDKIKRLKTQPDTKLLFKNF